jgi:hypothetical protein
MSWLTSDVHMAETDAQQLRLHLGWLLEDLRARSQQPNERAEAVATLMAQLDDHLARLGHLETLLVAVQQSVE